jgi:hypothetical protein
MNFFKIVARVVVLLFFALIAIFFIFKPDDLLELNSDFFASLFPEEIPDPVAPKTPPTKHAGSNVEEMNYIKIFLNFMLAFAFFQMDAIKIGLVDVVKHTIETASPKKKWIFLNLLYLPPLGMFLFYSSSFFQHLPQLFGDVEWVDVVKRRGRPSQSFHVWSSGWSYLLLQFSSALCHLGILLLHYKVRQPKKKIKKYNSNPLK